MPEQTQLEDLSDASFLGKHLVLPANVRLEKRFLPGANTLAYLASLSAMKKKKFYNIDKRYKTFSSSLAKGPISQSIRPWQAFPT